MEEKYKIIPSKLLSDIYDIVEKFGTINEFEQIIGFNSGKLEGLNYQLYISMSNIPGNKNLIISKHNFISGGSNVIDVKDGIVLWDKSLTNEETINAIKKIDEFAKNVGLINSDNIRLRIPEKLRNNKIGYYKVDEIFAKKGTGFLVPPEKIPHDMLDQFDQPEKLAIIETPYGYVIQHKDHLSYNEKRIDTALKVLKEKNIDLNDLSKIDFNDILKIRKDIETKMETENIKEN